LKNQGNQIMAIQAIKSLGTAELNVQPIKVSSGYWNLRISSATDPDKELVIEESDLSDFSAVVLATRRLNTQVAIAKGVAMNEEKNKDMTETLASTGIEEKKEKRTLVSTPK
jgi:hypothetical protein